MTSSVQYFRIKDETTTKTCLSNFKVMLSKYEFNKAENTDNIWIGRDGSVVNIEDNGKRIVCRLVSQFESFIISTYLIKSGYEERYR